MSKLFRLDASIRAEGSVTRSVADTFQRAAAPAFSEIIHREIGLTPLPSNAWREAVMSLGAPPPQGTDAAGPRPLAATLADEVVAADAFLFAIPLYNFGVAQQAKTWIDLLLLDPRLAPGQPSAIAGRPAWLVTARGGGYGPGTPREGWDHSTPWLRRMFADVWGLVLQPIEIELTLADVTPAMEFLRPMAAENLRRAHADATRLGSEVAPATPASTAAA